MANSIPHITAGEFRILKVLWSLGSATVRDVKDSLAQGNDDELAYTTVMTMMNQLAAKGALAVDKTRQPFVYEPALRREQVVGQRISQFLHQVFDGQAGELVLRLVEESDISPEDLKRIEAKIEARETGESKAPAPRGKKVTNPERGAKS